MKYFVSYSVMDTKLGANPLGHAFLLLSQMPGKGQKVEVTQAWGFYGTPASNTSPLMRFCKKVLGLNIDLQESHGLLQIEEMRFLDKGIGLHGKTFEISFAQYTKLKKQCHAQLSLQKAAISEAKEKLRAQGKPSTSYNIFRAEKQRALVLGVEPRLKPFEVHLAWDFWGPRVKGYTCKNMALDLLQSIGIPQNDLRELTYQDTSFSIPRFSGPMERILLHSEGPLQTHVSKRTGRISFFRQWEARNKLFWTLPPQIIFNQGQNLTTHLESRNSYPLIYSKSFIEQLSTLQQLEFLLLNTPVENHLLPRRQALIQRVHFLYSSFSKAESHNESKFHPQASCIADFLNDMYDIIHEEYGGEDADLIFCARLPEEAQEEICHILKRPSPGEIESALRI